MLPTSIPSYHRKRREKLMHLFPDKVFVFPSNHNPIRTTDQHFPFFQDRNLYYLTGLEESSTALILAGGKSILFVEPRDPHKELWEGEMLGVDRSKALFNVDICYPISEFWQKLKESLKSASGIFYRLGLDPLRDRRMIELLEEHRKSEGRTGKGLLSVEDSTVVVGEMRLFKETEEIELHQKACRFSAKAHQTIMKWVRPGMNEKDVSVELEYHFKKNGCEGLAYTNIVASGKNATCLHYHQNNEDLRDGDLLLIDASGVYQGYNSDITRTFPVGKRYSTAQANIYDIVLEAQKKAIMAAKPGVALRSLHELSTQVMTDGLQKMNLIKKDPSDIKKYFPHGTSHWLGLDVHDLGLYEKNGELRKLEPGMVFTIEPGLYFAADCQDVPQEYRGIGVRIEDDVVVTSSGVQVMTSDASKERAEIEALRN